MGIEKKHDDFTVRFNEKTFLFEVPELSRVFSSNSSAMEAIGKEQEEREKDRIVSELPEVALAVITNQGDALTVTGIDRRSGEVLCKEDGKTFALDHLVVLYVDAPGVAGLVGRLVGLAKEWRGMKKELAPFLFCQRRTYGATSIEAYPKLIKTMIEDHEGRMKK